MHKLCIKEEKGKMDRKKRTDEELQKASEHLYYEFWMFNSLANGMASGIFSEGVINNALLHCSQVKHFN